MARGEGPWPQRAHFCAAVLRRRASAQSQVHRRKNPSQAAPVRMPARRWVPRGRSVRASRRPGRACRAPPTQRQVPGRSWSRCTPRQRRLPPPRSLQGPRSRLRRRDPIVQTTFAPHRDLRLPSTRQAGPGPGCGSAAEEEGMGEARQTLALLAVRQQPFHDCAMVPHATCPPLGRQRAAASRRRESKWYSWGELSAKNDFRRYLPGVGFSCFSATPT